MAKEHIIRRPIPLNQSQFDVEKKIETTKFLVPLMVFVYVVRAIIQCEIVLVQFIEIHRMTNFQQLCVCVMLNAIFPLNLMRCEK